MAISVSCASCGKKYNLADHLLGKQVKCKECGKVILVQAGPPAPAAKTTPKTAASRSELRPGPPKKIRVADDDVKRPRRRPVDDEDDDDRPRSRRRKAVEREGSNVLLVVGGIGGLVLFLGLAGGAAIWLLRASPKEDRAVAAFAANVNPPDVAPAPPKIVKQNDPPPQTVKRNAPAPKAKLELEDDWATMQIPQTPIAGTIRGKDFTPDKIALETGGLVFRQGNGVFADIEVRLFLFLKSGESPENKTYEIPPAAFIQGGSPRINLSTKEPADELPKTEMISSRYALKLSFGAEMDGTLPGRIHLRLPDAGKSFLAGTFSVKTAAAAKSTPGAPTNPGAGPVADGPPAPAGFRLVTGNDGDYQFLFPVKAKRTSTREQSIARGNLKGKSQINQCELADGTALIVAAEKLSGPALKAIEISELYDLTVEPIKKQGYDVTEAKEFLFGAEKGREYFFTKKGIVIRKVMLIRRDGRVFEMAVASGSQEQVTNATAETFIQSLKILAKGAANPP